MASTAEALETRILNSEHGVLDPPDIHHEFTSGMHGKKLQFKKIPTDSELFNVWVDAVAEKVDGVYSYQSKLSKVVLLSIASGTNRLVEPLADRLGSRYISALTEKDEALDKAVRLTQEAARIVSRYSMLVVAVEDVGATGGTTAIAAKDALRKGAQKVEAVITWKRRPTLEKLDEISVVYHAVIDHELPTYPPDNCEYCNDGVRLITRAEEQAN
jgi:phosphoribosylpyrophosphate synthetase